jgi:hypothetical protein
MNYAGRKPSKKLKIFDRCFHNLADPIIDKEKNSFSEEHGRYSAYIASSLMPPSPL